MFEAFLQTDWGMMLFAIPFGAILLISVFRLDELLATPRKRAGARRPALGLDRDGNPMLCDPDGRTWSRIARRR